MPEPLAPMHVEPKSVRPPFDRPSPVAMGICETTDQWRARCHRDTVAALIDAIGPDVDLGDYDYKIIAWLAGWDTSVIGTVASLLHRVRAAGERVAASPITEETPQ